MRSWPMSLLQLREVVSWCPPLMLSNKLLLPVLHRVHTIGPEPAQMLLLTMIHHGRERRLNRLSAVVDGGGGYCLRPSMI